MPLKRCQHNKKLGYKWGDSGKCYVYTSNDKSSRQKAKNKAKKQGRAIEVSKSSN